MKKQIILPILAAFIGMGMFTACSNADKNDKLQEPLTAPATETSSKNEGAEKATTATQATVITNLTDAFTGETTASAKYAAYSKKAQEEGFPQIAMLFKAASASEKIHANNHQAVLEDLGAKIPDVKPAFTVKTTQENLKDAIAGESYEISTMYPEFLTNAKTVGSQMAMISLNYAYKTEQKHKLLYDKALSALQSNEVKILSMEYYVCPTCGNTYDAKPPKRCGISMTNADKFVRIGNV
jgi:rubrerythrin